MQRHDWAARTDSGTAYRRAAGRRRYNAERRRRAEERRAAIAELLDRAGPAVLLFRRCLAPGLARAFGVHRSTVWRDLQRLLYLPPIWEVRDEEGRFVCMATRACQGGPVVSVTDSEDREIRGERRRAILRQLPRYCSNRARGG